MKIIIAPARIMQVDTDSFPYQQLPQFLKQTKEIWDWLRSLTVEQLTDLWQASPKIVQQNYQRMHHQNLTAELTPAIIAFTGLQYQSMAPDVFSTNGLAYIEKHLRILSGFYGLLRPFDGIVPYRLAMKEPAQVNGKHNLYEFWNKQLYQELYRQDNLVLDLASVEYEKAIIPYLQPDNRFIKCVFGEIINGKVKQKATLAKIARGSMVRYLAENQIQTIEGVKQFSVGGYQFTPELSTSAKLVFIKG